MSNQHLDDFAEKLQQLKQQGQYRSLPDIQHQSKYIIRQQHKMLNMASNDYLGLANDEQLKQQFLEQMDIENTPFSSSSSRLLTGNFTVYEQLEQTMAQAFGRESCLLFNSGYHMNIGILPAIADKQTLLIADKLVHASMIDGIRLSGADFIRYRHNDYEHLTQLIEKNITSYNRIIIITESIFSMDGDIADLKRLVALKQQYPSIMLYVDEAHAIGAYGATGLGMAEQLGCIQEIDFLVGTFGKAMASVGGYLICSQLIKEYLVNTMRPLIFSTGLPPMNIAWTLFLFQQLHTAEFHKKRQHLAEISVYLRHEVAKKNPYPMLSESCIVPYIIGDNEATLKKAQALQQQGYYCLPIRPPTVPKGTARIRLSLTADMSLSEVEQFVEMI